jgi:hypothetical protein
MPWLLQGRLNNMLSAAQTVVADSLRTLLVEGIVGICRKLPKVRPDGTIITDNQGNPTMCGGTKTSWNKGHRDHVSRALPPESATIAFKSVSLLEQLLNQSTCAFSIDYEETQT